MLGLPRIVCTADDLNILFDALPSSSNGITLCVGTYSSRADNNLPQMATDFGERIHFTHLRGVSRDPNEQRTFYEDTHLGSDVDMVAVIKTKQSNTAMAFILASWVVFIAISLKKGTLNDPNHHHFETVAESESEPYIHAMLKVANANNFAFFNDNAFMSNVAAWYDIIQAQGIANSLSTYLKTQ